MIDKAKIKELIKWRETAHVNYPWTDRDFFTPMFNALGDDEDEIISFIKETDDDTRGWISGLSSELYAKFPSDKMSDFINSTWPLS